MSTPMHEDGAHAPSEEGQRWAPGASGGPGWPTAPGGWSVPSPGGMMGGGGQKINPSPKRPYGQVQRIAEDQWRCPDGKTFARAYLAYRHLKELKEKNPTILSPYKSPRTSTAERRALQQRAFVGASATHSLDDQAMLQLKQEDQQQASDDQKRCIVDLYGSRLDSNGLEGQESVYELCRAWCMNDPNKQGKRVRQESSTESVTLPAPLPHTEQSMATDYGKKVQPDPQELDKILQSAPDMSPSVLLKMHKVYAQSIKNWWHVRQQHRVSRFKKPRIDLILPDGVQIPTGDDDVPDAE